jgi:(p)ppGpp synthase/HD superfamily hydrolase
MIHAGDCHSLDRANPDRILPAYWYIGEKGKVVSFTFLFHDVSGLLARLTKICYDMGVNIVDMNTKTHTE